jgi:hypothetical protein
MAAGDVKGFEVRAIQGTTGGTAITKGQVVHLETTNYHWETGSTNFEDLKGVALSAGAIAGDVTVAIWGRVEVTADGLIYKGQRVKPTQAGKVMACTCPNAAVGLCMGIAMENITSGNTGTIWIGL